MNTPTPHRATDEQWRSIQLWACPDGRQQYTESSCILELREALAALVRRVGALEGLTTTSLADVADAFEQAAQRLAPAAAPSPPAGLLVEVVMRVIVNAAVADTTKGTAQDIIAAIAEELHRRGDHGVAAWMEREAGL
jgi:hypothetical protein